MKRILFVILIILFSCAVKAQEQTAPNLMDSALNAYTSEMYSDAMRHYRFIADTLGEESAALYYNMGNVSYKMNDLASTILYYEKSLKISPNDEDVLFNLGLVNSRIPDKIEILPEVLPVQWYKTVVRLLTPNQWAYLTIILLSVTLIMLTLYFIAKNVAIRKTGFWVGIILLGICVFSFIVAQKTTKDLTSHDTAIVFSPSVTIKSSPEAASSDLFVLHEGSKVWVLDTLNNWYKIKIANGSVGWIPAELVEKI